MNENQKAALKLALAVLQPFKESGLYDDYQADEDFTDEHYDDMLATLTALADGSSQNA